MSRDHPRLLAALDLAASAVAKVKLWVTLCVFKALLYVMVHYGYCKSDLTYRTGGLWDGGVRNAGYVSAEFGRAAAGSGR